MPVLDRAFAAFYDPIMRSSERAGLGARRRELLADLRGDVVEIGAGTGANLDHLDVEVERATLLEPAPAMAARLREHAAAHPYPFGIEVIEAPAEAIPLPDASADAVISTLVLCSVDDLDLALSEIRRILRPGGALVIIEHVRGAGATATVQRIIEPAWKTVGRGCHLTRDTRVRIAEAGFDVSALTPWQLPAPAPAAPAISGVAQPC